MQQNKLMKINDYPDGDSHWRIACDCSDPAHDISLWFDANANDKEFGIINLNLSTELSWYHDISYHSGWWDHISRPFKVLWWRIKMAAKFLFIGHHIMTGDVILDLEGIKAMQMALEEGLKFAKKH